MAFVDQLKAFWASLSNPKRMALVLITSAVLLGVLAMSVLGGRVNYAYLASELDPSEAAEVVQKLDELKIPYSLHSGGTAIQVPRDRMDEAHMQLATEGLPRGGGPGNRRFKDSPIGQTEFQQQVSLRLAMEEELARSVRTLDSVRQARVHLVLPKRRLFVPKAEGASASVVLQLQNKSRFGRREVAGIVHLVASAVPDLSPDRVSVVDTSGATLHRPDQGDGAGAGAQGGLGEDAEQAIQQRVQSLLERHVGPGAAEVRVSLELDSASHELTSETHNPAKTAIVSEQQNEEWTGVEGATVGGVPGAQTNLPDVEPTVGAQRAEGGGSIVRRNHTRNWQIDRVVERILKPAGEVQSMSVSVLVDGKYEEQEGQQVYVPRTDEELQVLGRVVRAAIGFDEERGDQLHVSNLRFARPSITFDEGPLKPPAWQQYVPYAAMAGGAAFVLAVVVLVWRSRKRRQDQQEDRVREDAEREEEFRLAAAEARLLEEERSTQEADVELDPALAHQRRTEALEIANTDPATAAIVLREWLVPEEVVEGGEAAQ